MKRHIGFAVFAVALISGCALFQRPTKPPEVDLPTRIREALGPQFGPHKNVGGIVGIYDRGHVEYISFGETKIGNQTAPDETTIFEIGSITKTFTGLLLSVAIEHGELNETTTVADLVPEWKDQKTSGITLLELATHRSGLPRIPCNWHAKDPEQPYADYSDSDMIQGLQDATAGWSPTCALADHPTKEMTYSNWGFGVLGFVLAKASGQSYTQLVRDRIATSLGLVDTSYDLTAAQVARLAQGYDEGGQEEAVWQRQALQGNGALRSTAADLITYAKAYLHPDQTLFPATLARSMRTHYAYASQLIGYAWQMSKDGEIWHDGRTGGYFSFIKIYPGKDFAAFYLTNTAKPLSCFVQTIEKTACHD